MNLPDTSTHDSISLINMGYIGKLRRLSQPVPTTEELLVLTMLYNGQLFLPAQNTDKGVYFSLPDVQESSNNLYALDAFTFESIIQSLIKYSYVNCFPIENVYYYTLTDKALCFFMKEQEALREMGNCIGGVDYTYKKDNYVYAIYNEETGYTKIGVSHNVSRRMSSIGSTTSSELHLLISFVCSDAYTCEKLLHKYFTNWRVKKEWFHLSSEEVLNIPSVARKLAMSNNFSVSDVWMVSNDKLQVYVGGDIDGE